MSALCDFSANCSSCLLPANTVEDTTFRPISLLCWAKGANMSVTHPVTDYLQCDTSPIPISGDFDEDYCLPNACVTEPISNHPHTDRDHRVVFCHHCGLSFEVNSTYLGTYDRITCSNCGHHVYDLKAAIAPLTAHTPITEGKWDIEFCRVGN